MANYRAANNLIDFKSIKMPSPKIAHRTGIFDDKLFSFSKSYLEAPQDDHRYF